MSSGCSCMSGQAELEGISRTMTLLERWHSFWFAPIPCHVYALLRILFGALGFASLIGLRDVQMFWALDGLVPADAAGLGIKAAVAQSGLAAVAPAAVYAGCLASFAGMTIGFRSGVSVPLSLAASLVQLAWNDLPLSAAHAVVQGVLFCLIWADCGSVWSVDAWLERRRTPEAPAPPYVIAPLRLIRFQIALVYLSTGLWKLQSPLWRDGSALHYVLNTNVFHRFPYTLPVSFEPVLTLATYTTLLWELSFAFLVLYGPTRRLALAAGVLIHVGMMAGVEVGPFSLVMLAGYVAFLDPTRIPALTDYLPRFLRRSRSTAPEALGAPAQP
jgi:vitamin K-dependent gamma-carboxylase-like protein